MNDFAITKGRRRSIGRSKNTKQLTRDDMAAFLEALHQNTVAELLHERRVTLPRLERHVNEALARFDERFVGEKNIARTVRDQDIPERERWIDAAMLLLNYGPDVDQARWLLADYKQKSGLLAGIIANGGLLDERSRWRNL